MAAVQPQSGPVSPQTGQGLPVRETPGRPLPRPADNRGPPVDKRDGQASHRRQATKKRRPKCRRAHNTSNSHGSRPRAPLPASNGKMSLRNARGPLRGSSARTPRISRRLPAGWGRLRPERAITNHRRGGPCQQAQLRTTTWEIATASEMAPAVLTQVRAVPPQPSERQALEARHNAWLTLHATP